MVSVISGYNSMLVVVKEEFWDVPKMSQNSPFTTTATVLGILSGPTTPWFFPKAMPRPRNFLSTLWTEKKNHQIWGTAWPGSGFSGICPKKLTYPHSEFFPIHVSGLEKISCEISKSHFRAICSRCWTEHPTSWRYGSSHFLILTLSYWS